MLMRCSWVPAGDELYEKYHDTEWGIPVHDDRKLFEFIVLESAQAGLSWRTVLGRREGYRALFAEFDPQAVAQFTEADVERLMLDARIIRNRAKITATIKNAQAFLRVAEEFGSFDKYLWQFVGGKTIEHHLRTAADYQPTSPESDVLAKDMKKRGFSFFGSTVAYAHMQAVGMVNDHIEMCYKKRG